MSWIIAHIEILRQTLTPLALRSVFDRWVIVTLALLGLPLLYLLLKIIFSIYRRVTTARTHIAHNDMLEQIKDAIVTVDDGMTAEELEHIDGPVGALTEQKETMVVLEGEGQETREWDLSAEQAEPEENISSDIVASSSVGEDGPLVQTDPDTAVRESLYWEKFRTDANYLKHRGKMEDYEKKLIEWLAMDPQSVEITRALADYYFASGQSKKALPLLKRVVEYHPDDHKALWQIAEMYLDAGDFETAEVLVNKACNLDHDNPKYATTMVEIYYNTGRIEDAIALMEEVVKWRPSHIGYREALAKLYEEVQDKELAQHCYYAILEIDPQHAKARKKLAR